MTTRSALVRPRFLLYGALGLVLACTDEPTTPGGVPAPAFTRIISDDSSRVLTVGADAPANLTVVGVVAGIVVERDGANIDLSKATVDCGGQPGTEDPRIGVWIDSRTGVHVMGGGTGSIVRCGIGVLIGPPRPGTSAPGGFDNRVDGLMIDHTNCPTGGYPLADPICDVAIAVSNSHDNVVARNDIKESTSGGVLLYGSDPASSASGRNRVLGNTMRGGFNDFGIYVGSNANTIRNNESTEPIEGIIVGGDSNLVSGNHISYGAVPIAFGIHLLEGAEANEIARNDILASDRGIVVDPNTFGNVISGNTAMAQDGPDAIDRSGSCANNTWEKNILRSPYPLCIDPTPSDIVAGRGTATIDGVIDPAEWASAGRVGYGVDLSLLQSPVSLYFMNDDHNLYVAAIYWRSVIDSRDNFKIGFDADRTGAFNEGDDYVVAYDQVPAFEDGFFTSRFSGQTGVPDTLDPTGRTDGSAAFSGGTIVVFEIAHPLNSGDLGHDIAIKAGDVIGWLGKVGLFDAGGEHTATFPDDEDHIVARVRTAH